MQVAEKIRLWWPLYCFESCMRGVNVTNDENQAVLALKSRDTLNQ